MKIQSNSHPAEQAGQHLHEMVDTLLYSSEWNSGPAASISNNVPPGVLIKTDSAVIAAVLDNLLQAVVRNSPNDDIRISAKTYSDVVVMHVRNYCLPDTWCVSPGLQKVQTMAEQLGGFLDITSQRQEETTIAFSFPNRYNAA